MPPASSKPRRWRVVLDTNSWISNYIRPHSLVAGRLEQLLNNVGVELLFSAELRDEILRVISRTKFSRFISPDELLTYCKQVKGFKLTTVVSEVAACRDPNDNFLLALCQDGHADFLITGDQDLLVLERFGPTRILSWVAAEDVPGLLVT